MIGFRFAMVSGGREQAIGEISASNSGRVLKCDDVGFVVM
jgi:hypothetical protein